MNRKEKEIKKLIIITHVVGFIGIAIPFTKPFFVPLVPLNLVVSLVLVLLVHEGWNNKFILASVVCTLACFFIEVLGVNTGFPFGNYSYSWVLSVKLFHTPFVIGIVWFLLLYCIYVVCRKISRFFLIRAIIGASIMALYDLAIEPVAMTLDFWQWDQRKVPLQNYLAWFGVSFIMLLFFHASRLEYKNKLAGLMLVVQISFMLMLNVLFFFKY